MLLPLILAGGALALEVTNNGRCLSDRLSETLSSCDMAAELETCRARTQSVVMIIAGDQNQPLSPFSVPTEAGFDALVEFVGGIYSSPFNSFDYTINGYDQQWRIMDDAGLDTALAFARQQGHELQLKPFMQSDSPTNLPTVTPTSTPTGAPVDPTSTPTASPLDYTNTAMRLYRGCYQDCGSVTGDYVYNPDHAPFGNRNPLRGVTRNQGDQGCSRICEPGVGGHTNDPETCRNVCRGRGLPLWGMACSRASSHECWCCNEDTGDSQFEKTCQQIPDRECYGGEPAGEPGFSGICDGAACGDSVLNSNAYRKGPDEDGDGLPDYFTGGCCRVAMYDVDPRD